MFPLCIKRILLLFNSLILLFSIFMPNNFEFSLISISAKNCLASRANGFFKVFCLGNNLGIMKSKK